MTLFNKLKWYFYCHLAFILQECYFGITSYYFHSSISYLKKQQISFHSVKLKDDICANFFCQWYSTLFYSYRNASDNAWDHHDNYLWLCKIYLIFCDELTFLLKIEKKISIVVVCVLFVCQTMYLYPST